MGVSGLPERRHTPDESGKVTCRVCFSRVRLDLDLVDETPMYVYHRCTSCENWFTIRRADVERLRDSLSDSASGVGSGPEGEREPGGEPTDEPVAEPAAGYYPYR
jgi:hypothetical protein